jgi:hypothetical protein
MLEVDQLSHFVSLLLYVTSNRDLIYSPAVIGSYLLGRSAETQLGMG